MRERLEKGLLVGCEGEREYADACVGVGGVDGLGAGC